MEFRVRRNDGTVRHVRSVARALLDSDEGITGYVGSVEDTTERLQSRRAIDDCQQRFKTDTVFKPPAI